MIDNPDNLHELPPAAATPGISEPDIGGAGIGGAAVGGPAVGDSAVGGAIVGGSVGNDVPSGEPVASPEREAPGSESPSPPAKKRNARESGNAVSGQGATSGGGSAGEPAEGSSEEGGEELGKMDWYILKVQSNREDSIREALQRRISIAGLSQYFDEIIVPTEMVSEFKSGKKKVVKRKLFPGYIVVHMILNEDTWFLVRETPGIGDFTGAGGKPSPMLPHEVSRIVSKQEEKTDEAPKLKISFSSGDRVKITEGTFENFEGDVDSIDQANGRVTVMINIFGRSTPVELEYWQIESL